MRGTRLFFEAIETTTMEDKMLMEEVLSNTGWTSADAEQIFVLRIRPAGSPAGLASGQVKLAGSLG